MSDVDYDWHDDRDTAHLHMLEKKICTDVKFVFPSDDGSQITVEAHRFILISRSSVFRAMLCGGFKEADGVIEINDIKPGIFKEMLRHMYSHTLGLREDHIWNLLCAAHKYQFKMLIRRCWEYWNKYLAPWTVAHVLDKAVFFKENKTKQICLNFLRYGGEESLEHFRQYHISRETLEVILDYKNYIAHEIGLFEYCVHWAKVECKKRNMEPSIKSMREILGELLFKIRLPEVPAEDLAEYVSSTGLLTELEELRLFRYIAGNEKDPMPFNTGERTFSFQFRGIKPGDKFDDGDEDESDKDDGSNAKVVLCEHDWVLSGVIFDKEGYDDQLPRDVHVNNCPALYDCITTGDPGKIEDIHFDKDEEISAEQKVRIRFDDGIIHINYQRKKPNCDKKTIDTWLESDVRRVLDDSDSKFPVRGVLVKILSCIE